MTTKKLGICLILCGLCATGAQGSNEMPPASATRTVTDLDFGWKFHKGDAEDGQKPNYEDSSWQTVNVPHDWSIEGPLSEDNAGGKSGGYFPLGIGWYRRALKVPAQHKDKKVLIEFDGIYKDSEVWINGHSLGKRWYGYVGFQYDLTPHICWNEQNTIAVRVDNSSQTCRWYSGSGIYRHVRLIVTDNLHVGHWGAYITTPEISSEAATVEISTLVSNERETSANIRLKTTILDAAGKPVRSARSKHSIAGHASDKISQKVKVKAPALWSVETPTLYYARTEVICKGEVVDDVVTPFGIRRIRWDSDKGLFVNDKPVLLKGVCIHHDLGALGSAFHEAAMKRRLKALKSIGCNAIRTSHNPPAPQLLDLCDRMGFLVIDEAFDKWGGNNYQTFEQDWRKDLRSMLERDRNHPSIILWSVGNEVRQQGKPEGVDIMKKLVDLVHLEEPTRPVTYGAFPRYTPEFVSGVDVAGLNYQEQWFEKYRRENPRQLILSTESFPYYRGKDDTLKAFNPINPWLDVPKHDYVVGAFYWTGIDYLGEAVAGWPYHGWNCSFIDTCGFTRPVANLVRSFWSEEPMVHIAVMDESLDVPAPTKDHWGWPKMASHWTLPQLEGKKVKVVTFTNCERVQLSINAQPHGVKRLSDFPDKMITWNIPYERGVIKAEGVNGDDIVCSHRLQDAGEPARIVLRPDQKKIKADSRDICHVEVSVTDEEGVLVPDADCQIEFDLKGPGRILAVDNGDLTSIEPYQSSRRKAFLGRCLVILQATANDGQIQLTASAAGLSQATVIVNAEK